SPTRAQSPSTVLENLDRHRLGPSFTCLSTPACYEPLFVVARSHAWSFLFILDIGLRRTPWGGGWSGHLHSGRKQSPAVRECCARRWGRPSPHGLKILASSK